MPSQMAHIQIANESVRFFMARPFHGRRIPHWERSELNRILRLFENTKKKRNPKKLTELQSACAKGFFNGHRHLLGYKVPLNRKDYPQFAADLIRKCQQKHQFNTDKAVDFILSEIRIVKGRFLQVQNVLAHEMMHGGGYKKFGELYHFMIGLIQTFHGHLDLVENQLNKLRGKKW
ncbi:MAG: hypothetical protein HYW50_00465 [Candidatus Diapherotrites archaeon]|nr:hypothetical protein [Candidatus Diapherotrites archaeon]